MKIIGISGRKQSGKNTTANYINGHILKSKDMVRGFFIDEDGRLIIETIDASGQDGYGIFDPTRKDASFIEYAERNLWPYVKIYHFADPLKDLAINLFDLNQEFVYGTDDQKNQKTELLWQNMPDNVLNKTGKITHREFLEHFGTCIIRKIKNNAWSEFTIKKILLEQPEVAIIPDVRFPNEVDVIQKNGGIVLRLTRDIFSSSADAEKALDKDNFDWANFDDVIDNQNISIQELCTIISENINKWGV